MAESEKVLWASVSDLALCQKCPALFAYKVLRKKKDAWRVGIQGTDFYGSIFHKNIAQKFFEAAANSGSEICERISGSFGSVEVLEECVRENFFIPFVEGNAQKFSGDLIMALARGVSVWVRAMHEFFSVIPDIQNNMRFVFHEPEKKLEALYDFDGKKLSIVGCYDALMFNPKKAEARLFEFKGYKKSDVIVPLSQSLIYAWLIYKYSGIVPAIEIIYLDETEKSPDIFSSQSVRDMILKLPGLFGTVHDILLLRSVPEFLRDENLCEQCKFKKSCVKDWPRIKRRGMSLLSVMVFMLLAVMISAQVFFFSVMSANSTSDEVKLQEIRITLDALVNDAKNFLAASHTNFQIHSADYRDFHTQTFIYGRDDVKNFHMHINNLKYNHNDLTDKVEFSETSWGKIPAHERIFPPMSDDKGPYFLIRAYTTPEKTSLMYQVLVMKDGANIKTLSHNEIWYFNK